MIPSTPMSGGRCRPWLSFGGGSEEYGGILAPLLSCLRNRSISTLVVFRSGGEGMGAVKPAATFDADLLLTTAKEPDGITHRVRNFGDGYDLLLVEREPRATDAAIEFEDEGKIVGRCRSAADLEAVAALLHAWLVERERHTPLWSCLLMGGASSRMGSPKHLLKDRHGTTWLERLAALLGERSDGVILAGGGDVPRSLDHLIHLPDCDDASGPLAGILSAMRYKPDVSWLVSACDLPYMEEKGIAWLLASRRPGRWGSVPQNSTDDRLQPLFAHYDGRARHLFEEMAASGEHRLRRIADFAKIATIPLPAALEPYWHNCNRPEDIRLERR